MRMMIFILLSTISIFGHSQNRDIVREMHFGGGVGLNDIDYYDSAIGIQFFGGYQFLQKAADTFRIQIEGGYWTSGDFDSSFPNRANTDIDGLWLTGVGLLDVSPKWALLARLGLDFGDDDGLMIGFGADYRLNRQISLRAEFVVRDNVDSLQANILYYID